MEVIYVDFALLLLVILDLVITLVSYFIVIYATLILYGYVISL